MTASPAQARDETFAQELNLQAAGVVWGGGGGGPQEAQAGSDRKLEGAGSVKLGGQTQKA